MPIVGIADVALIAIMSRKGKASGQVVGERSTDICAPARGTEIPIADFEVRFGSGKARVFGGDLDKAAGRIASKQGALRPAQYFDAGDVVRHPLVQRIVQAYEAQDDAL